VYSLPDWTFLMRDVYHWFAMLFKTSDHMKPNRVRVASTSLKFSDQYHGRRYRLHFRSRWTVSSHIDSLTRYISVAISEYERLTTISAKASEYLLDISQYVRLGQNKLSFLQVGSMSGYALVMYSHHPTQSQLESLRARWDYKKCSRELLSWLVRPILPDEW
jgi:hypothetical protein